MLKVYILIVVIGLVGGVVGGPAGAIALTELARRENKKIAEKVVTNVMGMVDSNKNPDGSDLDTGTLSILNTARVNANYNIMNIDNNINFAISVFMITGLNLIISLYLPFILTITDLIKKG